MSTRSGQIPTSSPESTSPVVDVRVVLFTIAGGRLNVALTDDHPALPRGNPERGTSLDETAQHIIRSHVQLPEQYLEQLYTLSLPGATGGWPVIVSYLALIESVNAPRAVTSLTWHAVPVEAPISQADAMVIEYALRRLRAKLTYTNIAFHLLPEAFTLSELQLAYETILGHPLDKRNFRRRMIASGILVDTHQQRREGSHRPAALYRFAASHDPATYLTPDWAKRSDTAS